MYDVSKYEYGRNKRRKRRKKVRGSKRVRQQVIEIAANAWWKKTPDHAGDRAYSRSKTKEKRCDCMA